jgi:DNA-binding LacI/PurR family transcriptional regulator
MATRREVNQQRLALNHALREQCRTGLLIPGQPAPPLRQLAEDFGISTRVASQVLQELIAEGMFHMVPRVGTFVGPPKVTATEFYLMLLPDEYGLTAKQDLVQIQHGFEERIAESGHASIAMPLQNALVSRAAGELPPLAGLFDMAYHSESQFHWGADKKIARVGFSGRIEDQENSDEVSYDDEGGGRLAARHLIDLGHRKIAFLALHSEHGPAGELIWSRERESGWSQALESYGLEKEAMAFYPETAAVNDPGAQIRAGRELGWQILARPEITAVIAANDFAAAGLLEAVRVRGQEPRFWPSVVGFDNRAMASGHLMTSMRLPAERLGRTAAELLLERRQGQLQGSPVHRRVPMQLISRLTSRRDWSAATGGGQLTTAFAGTTLT